MNIMFRKLDANRMLSKIEHFCSIKVNIYVEIYLFRNYQIAIWRIVIILNFSHIKSIEIFDENFKKIWTNMFDFFEHKCCILLNILFASNFQNIMFIKMEHIF